MELESLEQAQKKVIALTGEFPLTKFEGVLDLEASPEEMFFSGPDRVKYEEEYDLEGLSKLEIARYSEHEDGDPIDGYGPSVYQNFQLKWETVSAHTVVISVRKNTLGGGRREEIFFEYELGEDDSETFYPKVSEILG